MPGVNLKDFSARFESVFIPERTEEVVFTISADDGCRVYVDGKEIISDWKNGPASRKDYRMNVEKGKKYDILIEYYQGGGKGALKFDVGLSRQIDY